MHYVGMHHANMVCDVVAGLQEVLQKDQAPIDTPATVTEPHKHVAKAVQSMQQKLTAKLHKMQTVNKAMQLQYSAAP